MIITIDGPSGTGKSTVARKVAAALKFIYVDTGAMYRMVTLAVLDRELSLDRLTELEQLLATLSFDIRQNGEARLYFLNGVDVTEQIRTQRVTVAVSAVSALPIVRSLLWKLQRECADGHNVVFEGRDMGSVVFPQAEVKIFLTAESAVRAQRRLKELKKMDFEREFDEKTMEEELLRRDLADSSRELAPLTCPEGAYIIDTSMLTVEEVVEKIRSYCCAKAKKRLPGWLKTRQMGLLYRGVLFIAWSLFRLFYRHRVYGAEHCIGAAAIIAPNHISYLDPPLVAIAWPQEVHFLARSSLFTPFIFGPLIRALNAHPVRGDVGDISVFKTLLRLLSEGKQVILFPQGGRREAALDQLKPGIGMLVLRSKCAIIPTYIHGTDLVWGKKKKWPKWRGKVACVFGSAILPDLFVDLDKKVAQEEISRRLVEAIQALKAWYEAGAKGTPP